MSDMVGKRIIFKGKVQGVGFRYNVRSLAGTFDIAGYVKNLPDGTVELLAQGTEENVAGLVDAVKRRMAGYISDALESPAQDAGRRPGFEIAF